MQVAAMAIHLTVRILSMVICLVPYAAMALGPMEFRDNRNRRINEQGLTIVDWEGEIANPVATVTVVPPSDATFPARIYLSMAQPRQYFDMPSTTGASGPRKEAELANATPWAFKVGIFPDDDGTNESRNLTVRFVSGNGTEVTQTLRVNVIDQDKLGFVPTDRYPVIVDFSKDQTGWFSGGAGSAGANRAVAQKAADDWSYFLMGTGLDAVPANAEGTWIYPPSGWPGGGWHVTPESYWGFKLYVTGLDIAATNMGSNLRSGGDASPWGFSDD